MKRPGERLSVTRWLIRRRNAAAFLAVPDSRWPKGQDGLQATYTVHVRPINGGFYGHCEQVDLMVQMPSMHMLDKVVRLGLCTLIEVSDHFADSFDIRYVEK